MRRPFLLLAALLFGLPAALGANTPPMRQPDQAAIEAARRLVAQLHLPELTVPAAAAAQRAAGTLFMAWERYDGIVPAGVDRAEFRSLFGARLATEARALVPVVMPEVEDALAASWAMRSSAAESEALRRFYASDEGRRFALWHVLDSIEFASLIEQRVHHRLSPRLPELVAESARGVALLLRINRPRRD